MDKPNWGYHGDYWRNAIRDEVSPRPTGPDRWWTLVINTVFWLAVFAVLFVAGVALVVARS